MSQNDRFDLVFGLNTTFSLTLIEMLDAKGRGANALGRHAAAALLNASMPGSIYPYPGSIYTAEDIKAAVRSALTQYQAALVFGADVSTEIDNIEALKDLYEAANQNQ